MRANKKSLVCVSVRDTLVAAALVVATSAPLAAQERALYPKGRGEEGPVEPGARVRVTAPDLGINKYTGVLEGVVGDTLAVDTLRLPLASVTRFEVHRGRKSRVGRGALIGAAVGVGSGAILGAVALSGYCAPDPCPVEAAAYGALYLVLPGLLVGTVVGALSKTDRWEAVPLDRIRVSLTSSGNGRLTILVSLKVP